MSKHGGVGSYHSAAERCQPSSVKAQIPATDFSQPPSPGAGVPGREVMSSDGGQSREG